MSKPSFQPTGDIVADILRYLSQMCPSVDAAQLKQLEREIRQAYGGDRVHVSDEAMLRRSEAVKRIVPGKSAREQAESLGLGRATIYRHLKKAFPE